MTVLVGKCNLPVRFREGGDVVHKDMWNLVAKFRTL